MKRRTTYILKSVMVLLLVLFACQKEVEIDIPGYEEKVVFDGRIETGFPPFLLISKTNDIYASTDLSSILSSFQSGAQVQMIVGADTVMLDEICSDNLPPGTEEPFAAFFGVDVADLAFLNICLYTTLNPSFTGQVGKTYVLNITFEGKTYSATTSIVPPVELDSVYWKEDPNTVNNGFCWARLTDPAGVYNAYFWESRRIHLNAEGEPTDPQFVPTFSPATDDTFFDGLSFEFGYENPHNFNEETPAEERGFYQLGDTAVIKFSSLDQQAYDFLEKKYIQLQSGGSPFASPINIPSQFSNGGLGSWIGYSSTLDTLYCNF